MLRIPKNFQHLVTQTPKDQAKSKLKTIEEAIDDIYLERKSTYDYQGLYENAWKLVLHGNGEEVYNMVSRTIRKHTIRMCESVSKYQQEAFLKNLLQTWERFSEYAGMLRYLLMYLDEQYVDKENTQNENDKPKILAIEELCENSFKIEVLFRLKNKIRRLILEIIQRERDNEIVADRFLMRNLTKMMTDIDQDSVYKTIFETPFLRESTNYYNRESQKYFESGTAVTYLRMVKKRLAEEEDRARKYMDRSTEAEIRNVVLSAMVERYKDEIGKKEGSGVVVMLENQKSEELRLVYEVLSQVPGALDPTIAILKDYCIREASAYIDDPKKDNNPEELVTNLMDLRMYYEQLLLDAFSYESKGHRIRDKHFSQAIKKAFDETINKHKRFPEYLSLLLDKKLKKGKNQIEDDKSDEFFDRIIMICRHLREKDIFEKYYKTHLAKRLLSGRSASDDAERSFLTKLKTSFGYQYTSKLEGMFKDMKLSDDLNAAWKTHQQTAAPSEKTPFDLNVQVLTHVYWPVNVNARCEIPEKSCQQATELFTKFYVNQHQGRKISWQLNLGTADMKANGFDKPYEFNVSTYQMAIMQLFNERNMMTFKDIKDQLKMPPNDLKRNIFALCMPTERGKPYSKLLLRKSQTQDKKLNDQTLFKINEKFRCQKIKIKILPVVKKEDDSEMRVTRSKIDEERKWIIDAVIVRIMKSRRHLHHRQLLIEVVEQLKNRFIPTPQLFKARTESLLDREYIRRDEENGAGFYVYQA